jgi:hypothetical protein
VKKEVDFSEESQNML